MSNDIVLSVRNLTKIFPAKIPFVALDHLSFDLHEGEILGLLGPNGAGKTTTIQMLLSTLKPTSGEIVYFGKNFFTNRSEILAQVAFASTYIKFPDKLTIRENLDVYGRLYGLTANERKHRIEKPQNQSYKNCVCDNRPSQILPRKNTSIDNLPHSLENIC